MISFAAAMGQALKAAGLSHDEFCELSGCAIDQLRRWLAGELPSAAELERCAVVFGVSAADLGGSPATTNENPGRRGVLAYRIQVLAAQRGWPGFPVDLEKSANGWTARLVNMQGYTLCKVHLDSDGLQRIDIGSAHV